jgi:hypothetical protein
VNHHPSPKTFYMLTSFLSDNAIFTDKLTNNLGPKIAEAVLPLGLPAASLPEFIGDLTAQNIEGLFKIPGVTPDIVQAGAGGLLEAYSLGFRFVWVAAGCFTVVAAVGMYYFFCSHAYYADESDFQPHSSSSTPSRNSTITLTPQPRRSWRSTVLTTTARALPSTPIKYHICFCLS